jgi:hypothetical protein
VGFKPYSFILVGLRTARQAALDAMRDAKPTGNPGPERILRMYSSVEQEVKQVNEKRAMTTMNRRANVSKVS